MAGPRHGTHESGGFPRAVRACTANAARSAGGPSTCGRRVSLRRVTRQKRNTTLIFVARHGSVTNLRLSLRTKLVAIVSVFVALCAFAPTGGTGRRLDARGEAGAAARIRVTR